MKAGKDPFVSFILLLLLITGAPVQYWYYYLVLVALSLITRANANLRYKHLNSLPSKPTWSCLFRIVPELHHPERCLGIAHIGTSENCFRKQAHG